ncbi:GNAT family N-acetyltransferase [Bacillus sp. Xin]|uniref:GNAT family N-acetyltransferase n=1 Tax=unclassified Bacillus (in: firmicutes) TaxID=185979 RepID=UPI0015745F44|nr:MULTISPECIES: GNAT family N-acetyltransferase [unclassified Bacillus (in: firmicutes)]MBC6976154.1 GNAT family N-acetyltransferase [Bacillus sp. Xin]NSW37336.1 GNAT family N-acetyltransferase [Bacillus sp. Xin1]
MPISKDTASYMIRTGTIEDSEATLDIQKSVVSEGHFLISLPEEFKKTSSEQREWVQGVLENERETLLVAEKDGKVVGWIVFMSENKQRLSHTGSFGIMISKSHRGLGIGKMLLQALLDWAEKNPLIEKVSLAVFSTNHHAISLYKQMGFIEEGRKIKEFKMDDNEYVDDILMYKLV